MKQINLTMDANGHITQKGSGGVMGDHMAAVLTVTMEEMPEVIQYYRLFFTGENGTVMSHQFFPINSTITYTLPDSVTGLGNLVLAQLCGYAMDGSEVLLLFKSDAFSLSFGTGLPDTATYAGAGFTDELSQTLNTLEQFADTFDVVIGTVDTLPPGSKASALLRREDQVFTLDLGIPQGADGIASFTAGSRITIQDKVISADSRPVVYNGVTNTYEYIGIDEPLTVAQLAGTVFFVNPQYSNSTHSVSFFTTGEGVYQTLYRFKDNGLVSSLPVGSVRPGRLMAIYVNNDGQAIYLNPLEESGNNPLPVLTVTPGDPSSSFPQLSFSTTDYSAFAGGKTVIAMATADISLDGVTWYGPMMSSVKVFNGSDWVSTSTVTGKTIKAGQPVFLYLNYQTDNYAFSQVHLLNVPE